MKYDILLIHASRNFTGRVKGVSHDTFVGLDILAACAPEKGFIAGVYDGEVNEVAAVIEREIIENHVRLIGFYCHFDNQTEVVGLSRFVKKYWNLPVLVGGPQSVALAGDFLSASCADVVVRGEGERAFLELLDYYLAGKGSLATIKGIVFREADGKVVVTPDRELIEDLDLLPFPDHANRISPNNFNMISVLSGRGCPFCCSFCYEGHNTKTVRYRSVSNVLTEVEQRLEREGSDKPQYLSFNDDTFTLNCSRVLEICDGLRKLRERYNFVWFCEAHANTIVQSPDIIPLMIQSGLVRLQIGLESGVQAILNAYRKQATLEQIETAISICAKYELPMVFCNVIVGGALETKDTIEETERFVDKLIRLCPGMLDVGTMLFHPYPKTAMTLRPQEFGISLLDPYSETSMGDYPVVETPALNREEINRLNLWLRSRINSLSFSIRDKVPLKRMLKIFELAYTYKIRGKWIGIFEESEHIGTYARQILYGGKCLSDIPSAQLPLFRPMRTLSFLKPDGEGVSLMRINLSPLESDMMRYSSGKLTITEMVQRLYPSYGAGISTSEFYNKVVDILHVFEQRYWVTFSAF